MPLKLSDAELDQLYAAARPIDVGLPSRTNVCTWRKRTCGPQGGSPGLTQMRHQSALHAQ